MLLLSFFISELEIKSRTMNTLGKQYTAKLALSFTFNLRLDLALNLRLSFLRPNSTLVSVLFLFQAQSCNLYNCV